MLADNSPHTITIAPGSGTILARRYWKMTAPQGEQGTIFMRSSALFRRDHQYLKTEAESRGNASASPHPDSENDEIRAVADQLCAELEGSPNVIYDARLIEAIHRRYLATPVEGNPFDAEPETDQAVALILERA